MAEVDVQPTQQAAVLTTAASTILVVDDEKNIRRTLSMVLDGGGQKEAHAFLDALEIFSLGYSWGGYESLAVHCNLSDRVVAKGPYPGPLMRLQIGLEDVEDLKADLTRALAASRA